MTKEDKKIQRTVKPKMKMKKIILLVVVSVFSLYQVNAQPPDKAARLEALKVAYITQQLALTPEEAQNFWPVYNKYFSEIKTARQENKDDEISFQESALNIAKKFKPDFKKVLKEDSRVNKIYTVDKNYHKLLRDELQRRQQMRQQRINRGN